MQLLDRINAIIHEPAFEQSLEAAGSSVLDFQIDWAQYQIFENLPENFKAAILAGEAALTSTESVEPVLAELNKEPEVIIEEPTFVVASLAAEEEEEEKDDGSDVPSTEEDEADTFKPEAIKSRVSDIIPDEVEEEEDVNDDTPASVLIKRERETTARKSVQSANFLRYYYKTRNVAPEIAEQHIKAREAKS